MGFFQVVIAGSQTAWTAGVESAIAEYRMEEFYYENLAMVCNNYVQMMAGLD